MKIVVTGTRGIPGIQGGVETHCEELFTRIADEKHEIVIVRRPQFISKGRDEKVYKGVQIKDIAVVHNKYLEAFLHTFFAVCYARWIHADIVHIHAIGPSLMTPVARLLGLKVVMTHHGADYDRNKWGKAAKVVLRLGERLGVKYANHVIVISKHILHSIRQKYPTQYKISLIHNGVNLTPLQCQTGYLQELGVKENTYILAVGRFVKEKGFCLLLDAYGSLPDKNIKLIIVGDADHEDGYSQQLKAIAIAKGAILTGFIQKQKLAQLYSSARLFVLPSYHEGLPISLLEAMNCHCDVLVSDIPANREINLPNSCYFRCGDVKSLLNKLEEKIQLDEHSISYDMTAYNWDYIAQQTKNLYDSLT